MNNCSIETIKLTKIESTLKMINRLTGKIFTFLLSSTYASIGKRTTIFPPLRFGNNKKISIGNHITIHSNCWIQVVLFGEVTEGPYITIGDYSGIGMNATITSARRIWIGEHVSFGRNVFVSDHNHSYENVNLPIALQGITKIKPVYIGDHSWLGHNVAVLPGARIGKHCAIGANSVVNTDIGDYSVAAGVPACVILRFDHTQQCWCKVRKED